MVIYVRMGSVWDFLIPEEQIEQIKQVFNSLSGGHFPHVHENHWLRKDGEARLISWFNSAIQNSDGTIRHIIATGSLFPGNGDKPEELLKKADIAMYQVKNRGRNNFQIFEET